MEKTYDVVEFLSGLKKKSKLTDSEINFIYEINIKYCQYLNKNFKENIFFDSETKEWRKIPENHPFYMR